MTIDKLKNRKFVTLFLKNHFRDMNWKHLLVIVGAAFVLSSCEKKEKPFPMPVAPELSDSTIEDQVALGYDYKTQVYYSFTNGMVSSSAYESWDLCFTTGSDSNEMWQNGGNLTLLYVTDATNFADINASYSIDSKLWKYDKTTGLPGQSSIGFLANNAAVGKVWIISTRSLIYKVILKAATATQYIVEVATGLDATTGTEYILNKDDKYNYVYLSLESGIVNPEPPKTDWDILFTRYRYIYEGYNPDGSDFLYGVTGVLQNPYNTLGASDSTKEYDFLTFTKDTFDAYFELHPNRDMIGWNWKLVDINTAKYKTLSNFVYVIKDQYDVLWKMHFINYNNNLGERGYPRFRYEKLK